MPPDYQDSVPDGYISTNSPTYWGYALLRSNLKSGSDSDRTQALLADAMQEVHAWLDVGYEAEFSATYYDNARWTLPAPPGLVEAITTGFTDPDSYPVDDRGLTYSWAFFSAKQLGTGQFYLMTIKDSDGHPFDGAATSRLTVPSHVPVTLYWSATAYDRTTHTLIRDMPWASRSSNTPDLQTDVEGAVDLYFAPAPPRRT